MPIKVSEEKNDTREFAFGEHGELFCTQRDFARPNLHPFRTSERSTHDGTIRGGYPSLHLTYSRAANRELATGAKLGQGETIIETST